MDLLNNNNILENKLIDENLLEKNIEKIPTIYIDEISSCEFMCFEEEG